MNHHGAEDARKRRRQLLVASAVGAVAAAAGAGWAWRRQVASQPAPGLWTTEFPGVEGRPPLAFAGLRGKPLVLNFWATWCAPCVRELPLFERFHQAYAARGWQVVGLAIDSPVAVADFLKRTPVSFPIGVAGMEGAELMIALGNPHGALPYTVVFDAEGRIIQKKLGETGYEDLLRWSGQG